MVNFFRRGNGIDIPDKFWGVGVVERCRLEDEIKPISKQTFLKANRR